MKKISSLFLALLIAFSLSTVAFAAPPAISVGQTKSITLSSEEETYYTFTSPETAIYKLTFKAKNDCWVDCSVYNSNDYYLTGTEAYQHADINENSYCLFPAQKGTVITIYLMEEYYSSVAKIDMTLTKANLPSLNLNGTYRVTQEFTEYSFIPSTSGYYNFRSNANYDNDPFIHIIDDDEFYLQNDDIGYLDDWNFDASGYFVAGRVYLVTVGMISYNGNINFSFTVKKADNIKPEYIRLDEEKISMARRDYYYTYAAIVPSGAVMDYADVYITSSNPNVADVEDIEIYGNEIYLGIASYKLGKTTITIELPDGTSADISVRVKSRFVLFFENLFSWLFGI